MPNFTPSELVPDFTSDTFQRDRYRHYAAYRSETPVFRNDTGNVYLTRYADCERLLADGRFTRQAPDGVQMNPFKRDADAPNALDVMVGNWMIFMDPPRHDAVRRAFSPALGAKAVRALEPTIHAAIRRLLDDWRGKPSVEFVSAFASPLPVFVLSGMLGIPWDDCPRVDAWVSDLTRAMDSGSEDEMLTAVPTSMQIRDYFSDFVRERANDSRDDLLGHLTAAARAGDLTHDELVYGVAFLLFAGYETTKNLLGNTMLTLSEHPDDADQLRRDPRLLPSAIEEVLRFESPFQELSRWTAAPASFGEYDVPEGALITALIGSANRDDAAFQDADRFDIRRTPNRHIAFSRGAHVCLGAMLARVESRIAIEALLHALPRIEVAGHRWRPISSFRSLERLTLALD